MLRTVDTKYGLVCYPAVNARHAVRSTGTFSSVLLDDSRCSFAAMLFGWPSNLGYQGGHFAPPGQTATQCTSLTAENTRISALFYDWHALCITHRARE